MPTDWFILLLSNHPHVLIEHFRKGLMPYEDVYRAAIELKTMLCGPEALTCVASHPRVIFNCFHRLVDSEVVFIYVKICPTGRMAMFLLQNLMSLSSEKATRRYHPKIIHWLDLRRERERKRKRGWGKIG